MIDRGVAAALLVSASLGGAAGLLVGRAVALQDGGRRARGTITGVESEAGGSSADDAQREGVAPVPPEQARAGRSVKIRGVRGTEGTEVVPENTVEAVSEAHGSIHSVPGIEGVDSVALENLEVVLRMQARLVEQQGKGGVSTAARLMTMDNAMEEPIEEVPDGREEMEEFELEGS